MFGTPFFAGDSFDLQRMTQADFDDYRRRLGENSPSPMDAFRFSQLSMAIDKFLSGRDREKYKDAIMVCKGKAPGNKKSAKELIRKIEEKTLRCSKEDIESIKSKNERREDNLPRGKKRVRVKDSGKKGKIISFYNVGGKGTTGLSIDFDDGNTSDKYTLADVVILCDTCDERPGVKFCSRCKAANYCGIDCQRKAWKQHKKVCGKGFNPDEWNLFSR